MKRLIILSFTKIIRVIKSRKTRWGKYVARIGRMRIAYKISVRKASKEKFSWDGQAWMER
jgi:hypothetical protein